MATDINSQLLNTVAEELLGILGRAETQVTDIVEFGYTQGVKDAFAELTLVKNTLIMLAEPAASELCDLIMDNIDAVVNQHADINPNDIMVTFLALGDYIERLATLRAEGQILVEKQDILHTKAIKYHLSETHRGYLSQAAEQIKQYISHSDEGVIWKTTYPVVKTLKSMVLSQGNYEYLWLVQQLAIRNIKGILNTPKPKTLEVLNELVNYLSMLVQEDETHKLYQAVLPRVKELRGMIRDSQLTTSLNEVYSPPPRKLVHDESSVSMVFPIAQSTIQAIAFFVKREIAGTARLFEQAYKDNRLSDKTTLDEIIGSLSQVRAAFTLLRFDTGDGLITDALSQLEKDPIDIDVVNHFSEDMVLLENSLWGLRHIEPHTHLVNITDTVTQQKRIMLFSTMETAVITIADVAVQFFKQTRENITEITADISQEEIMALAERIHDFLSSADLIDQQELVASLQKAEQFHLYWANNPELLSSRLVVAAYLETCVAYEIAFDQLQHSLEVDQRAIKLLKQSHRQLNTIAEFDIHRMADATYRVYDSESDRLYKEQQKAAAATAQLTPEMPVETHVEAAQGEQETVKAEQSLGSDGGYGSGSGFGGNGGSGFGGDMSVDDGDDSQELRVTFGDKPGEGGSDLSDLSQQAQAYIQLNHDLESLPKEEIDEELLDIFLSEGQRITEQLLKDVKSLGDNPTDAATLKEVERAYHTLKGSGRMVGLNIFGEFAWQHEELLRNAETGKCTLNAVAQHLLNESNTLLQDIFGQTPFVEDKPTLLAQAGKIKAVSDSLTSQSDKEKSDLGTQAQVAAAAGATADGTASPTVNSNSSLSQADIQNIAEQVAKVQPLQAPRDAQASAESQAQAQETQSPTAQVQATLAEQSEETADNVGQSPSLAVGKSRWQALADDDDDNVGVSTAATRSFVNSIKPRVAASKTHFDDWKAQEYQKNESFESLKENIDEIHQAGEQSDYADSQAVTETLSTTLSAIADNDAIHVDEQTAQPIKAAIDDLSRMHDEVEQGGSGKANPSVLDLLTAVRQQLHRTAEELPARDATDTDTTATADTASSVQTVDDISSTATPTSTPDAAAELSAATAALKSQLLTDMQTGHSPHSAALQQTLSALEQSANTTSSTWATGLANSISKATKALDEAGLSLSPSDYQTMEQALDALAQPEKISEQRVDEIQSALNAIGDHVAERSANAEQAEQFGKNARPELNATQSAHDAWKAAGHSPTEPLSDLLKHVGSVSEKAKSEQYAEGEALATAVGEVLDKLDTDSLVPKHKLANQIQQAVSELTSEEHVKHGDLSHIPQMAQALQAHVGEGNTATLGTPYAQPVATLTPSQAAIAAQSGTASPPQHQVEFAINAAQPINAAQQHYESWKGEQYQSEESLSQLSTAVADIQLQADRVNYDDAAELTQSMSAVLSRVDEEKVIPSDSVAQALELGLYELDTAKNQVASGVAAAISQPVIQQMQKQATTSPLGEPIVTVAHHVQPHTGEQQAGDLAPSTVALAAQSGNPLPPQHQVEFVDHAAQPIDEAQDHYDSWKGEQYQSDASLSQLSTAVADINHHAEQVSYDDAANLTQSMSNVLSRVDTERVIPSNNVAQTLEQGLQELTTAKQKVESGTAATLSQPVIQQMQKQAESLSLGEPITPTEQPVSQNVGQAPQNVGQESQNVGQASQNVGQASQNVGQAPQNVGQASQNVGQAPQNVGQASQNVDQVPQNVDQAPQNVDQAPQNVEQAPQVTAEVVADQAADTPNYQAFAETASPHISASHENFSHWKSSQFVSKSSLGRLSDDVQSISEASQQASFEAAAELSESVSGILDRVSKENLRPNQQTANHVEGALQEFERSATAIQTGQGDKEIQPQIIQSVSEVMNAPTIGQPIDPLTSIHDLLLKMHSQNPAEQQPITIEQDVFGFETEDSPKTDEATALTEEMQTLFKADDPTTLDNSILTLFIDEASVIIDEIQQKLEQPASVCLAGEELSNFQRRLHTLKGGAKMAGVNSLGELSHRSENLLSGIVEGRINDLGESHLLMTEATRIFKDQIQTLRAGVAVKAPLAFFNQLERFIAEQFNRKPELLPVATDEDVVRKSQSAKYQLPKNILVSTDAMQRLLELTAANVTAKAQTAWGYSFFQEHLADMQDTMARIERLSREIELTTETGIMSKPADYFSENSKHFDPLELDRFTLLHQQSRTLAEVTHDFKALNKVFNYLYEVSQEIRVKRDNIQDAMQDVVMSMATTDFSQANNRIETMVNQVAKRLGKSVNVRIYGAHTVIEKRTLDSLVIAIEHAVRNSLAHGIESPEERVNSAKPIRGQITLIIRREGSDIWIMIADDGRGVDIEKVRHKARALTNFDESREDDEGYILNHLFRAGFTTESAATHISGRGIGLDVIYEIVKSMNGEAQITSRVNEGFNLAIRVPYGMSITKAIQVVIDDYHYLVPLNSLKGFVRLELDVYQRYMDGETILYPYGGEEYRVISPSVTRETQQKKLATFVPCLLVRVGVEALAIVVTELMETQEIVIESGNSHLTQVPGIIGLATIKNSDNVPVLDMSSFGRHLLLRENRRLLESEAQAAPEALLPQASTDEDRPVNVLVVDDSITMRTAAQRMLDVDWVNVQLAKNGFDAIDVIKDWTPDIILLDIEMPKMDGFEFAAYLREEEVFKDIPIIIITSRSSTKHKQRAKALGVKAFLSKPFSKVAVLESISSILDGEELENGS